uniref:Variant surface glycoprotein 1854 n=1 Tax=Trypanosoma brucei TaxID=5691 RepID=M4T173_9TRYP|nr:variant surface glycoprotein 1854 [Trypanosoma brucei]
MLILVVLLLISIDAASRHGSGAAGVGLKNTVWKPICQLSVEIDGVSAGATHRIQQTISHVKTMQLSSLRAAVYAAKHAGTSKALQGTLMQDYFERRRTAAETALQTSVASGAVKAAATSAYLKGRIDEYINLLANTKDTTNNACLLSSDANGAAATIAPGTIGGEACKLRQTQRQAEQHTAKKLTSAGITDLIFGKAESNNHQPAVGSTQHKCNLLSGHHVDGVANTGSLEADFYVMGGYMKIKRTSNAEVDLTGAAELKNGNGDKALAW